MNKEDMIRYALESMKFDNPVKGAVNQMLAEELRRLTIEHLGSAISEYAEREFFKSFNIDNELRLSKHKPE